MLEVWKLDLRAEAGRLDLHRSLLSDDERDRARRFVREEDRIRFVLARSTRRELLARALDCDPGRLTLEAGPFGKPRLAGDFAGRLEFNTSHAGNWVLHAIADIPVGVDVAQADPGIAVFDELAWALSPQERDDVARHPEPTRSQALASAWARKEAYLKATGEGLSRPPSEIAISPGPDGRPRLDHDRNRNREGDARAWSFVDVFVAPGYAGCLVHAGPPRAVSIRSYAGAGASR